MTLAVTKNQLTKDKKLFVPTGFNSVVLYHAQVSWGFKKTYDQWDNSVASIKRLGGNTCCLKVLQSPLLVTNPGYVSLVKSMVHDCHAQGLSVVLCLQDQVQPTATSPYSNMSLHINRDTLLAWKQLAPAFAEDLDVMFELFNEPDYSSTNWDSWRHAMQPLVDQIRKTNQNVIWVPGGAEWDGTTHHKQMTMHGCGTHGLLHHADGSPYKNVGYSIHPYNYAHSTPTEDLAWHDRYSYVTAVAPLLFSEGYFDFRGNIPLKTSVDFLAMCKKFHIGYLGWVIDSPGSQELVTYNVADTVWKPVPTPSGQPLVDWFAEMAK